MLYRIQELIDILTYHQIYETGTVEFTMKKVDKIYHLAINDFTAEDENINKALRKIKADVIEHLEDEGLRWIIEKVEQISFNGVL